MSENLSQVNSHGGRLALALTYKHCHLKITPKHYYFVCCAVHPDARVPALSNSGKIVESDYLSKPLKDISV